MATNAQEGPSGTPPDALAAQQLFAGMFDILKATPLMPVAGLPGAQEWANKFFKSEISLDPQAPFIVQMVSQINKYAEEGDISFDATHWDPYDEGYDDGPGDLMDSWNTNSHSSTGAFMGATVDCDNVFDPLGAVIICTVSVESDDVEDIEAEFVRMAEHDWKSPATQEERDAVVVRRMRVMWGGLSPEARVLLLAEFNSMQV